jgi:hypothetical protein
VVSVEAVAGVPGSEVVVVLVSVGCGVGSAVVVVTLSDLAGIVSCEVVVVLCVAAGVFVVVVLEVELCAASGKDAPKTISDPRATAKTFVDTIRFSL